MCPVGLLMLVLPFYQEYKLVGQVTSVLRRVDRNWKRSQNTSRPVSSDSERRVWFYGGTEVVVPASS